jgi:small subunit ribosomal protein S18
LTSGSVFRILKYSQGFNDRSLHGASGFGAEVSLEEARFMPRKRFGRNRKNRCRFCTPEGCPRPAYVDYKDVGLLKKLCTNQSKMFSRKRSGNCAAFQRAASTALKNARFMALLPYVGE